ncbi:MAG: hypothetical protein HGA72_05785 [Chlorobiaceae bacterium]|nr:hypothetical protein [Chlorobiaceae bacterium]
MSRSKLILACKKSLLVTWLTGAGLLAFVLIGQTMSGLYVDHASDAWGWFLPNVMPTLSLMIGAVVKDFSSGSDEKKMVDSFIYQLSLGLSVAYFVVMASSVLLQPSFCTDCDSPLDFLQQSNLWLGPMQGLVTGALGFFFVKAEQVGKVSTEKK